MLLFPTPYFLFQTSWLLFVQVFKMYVIIFNLYSNSYEEGHIIFMDVETKVQTQIKWVIYHLRFYFPPRLLKATVEENQVLNLKLIGAL